MGVKRNRFINQWFDLNMDGSMRHAKCVDIEFETGNGPMFLMQTRYGSQFWLTRRELEYYAPQAIGGKR